MSKHTITTIRQLLLLQEAYYSGALKSKGYDGEYILVEKKSGHTVGKGSTVTNFRGDKEMLTGGYAPKKAGSEGTVTVKGGIGVSYASVYGLKWVKDLSKYSPKKRPMHKWKSANYDDDDTPRNAW